MSNKKKFIQVLEKKGYAVGRYNEALDAIQYKTDPDTGLILYFPSVNAALHYICQEYDIGMNEALDSFIIERGYYDGATVH